MLPSQHKCNVAEKFSNVFPHSSCSLDLQKFRTESNQHASHADYLCVPTTRTTSLPKAPGKCKNYETPPPSHTHCNRIQLAQCQDNRAVYPSSFAQCLAQPQGHTKGSCSRSIRSAPESIASASIPQHLSTSRSIPPCHCSSSQNFAFEKMISVDICQLPHDRFSVISVTKGHQPSRCPSSPPVPL